MCVCVCLSRKMVVVVVMMGGGPDVKYKSVG